VQSHIKEEFRPVITEQILQNSQMTRAAYRQKLRQALNNPQKNSIKMPYSFVHSPSCSRYESAVKGLAIK